MSKLKRISLYALVAISLCLLGCCASMGHGPISEPIVGIGAALLAALDQLLAGGVLSPEQYAPIAGGVRAISSTVQTVMENAAALQRDLAAAKAAQWTPAEIGAVVTAGSTLVAGAAAAVNNKLRDRHYTPEELLERKVKALRQRTLAKTKAA